MKKLLIVFALIVGVLTIFGFKHLRADSYAPNCGTSAVVQCGVYDQSKIDTATSEAKALYSKLGISTNLSTSSAGIVYPSGEVKVGDKVVATGAMTFGRVKRANTDVAYSAGGFTFWKHSITGAAINKPVDAYVFFDGSGKFVGAIIKMCGNPVVGVPVNPPEPPKPQSITCDVLNIIDKKDEDRYVKVSVSGTPQNTSISGYRIVWGDNTPDATTATAEHTYNNYGEYEIRAYVKGKIGNNEQEVTGAGCVVKVKFEEQQKPEKNISCKAIVRTAFNYEKRYINVRVDGTATNTTIDSYKIDFGDGTVVNEQNAEHTYAAYGKYTIKGYVTGKVNGEEETVGGEYGCVTEVEFTEGPKPCPTNPSIPIDDERCKPCPYNPELNYDDKKCVAPAKELPKTGPGAFIGLFSGVSILGAVAHRFWISRRMM